MAGTSNDFELSDELSKLLTSNGWKESSDLAGSFLRSHQIDGYLWTEELNIASKQRLSYVQNITFKPDDLSRSLGETAQRCAHLVGELFAAQVPFRRTGLGKMRAYREGEILAKAAGMLLTEGLVDDKKLFMIVHASSCTLEDLVAADSVNEAAAHIMIMRKLSGAPEEPPPSQEETQPR